MKSASWTVLALRIAWTGILAGCTADRATEPRPTPGVAPPALPPRPVPTAVSLAITPESVVTVPRAGFFLTAMKVMSDGTRVPANASWWSSADSVVVIDEFSGHASAMGGGRATIHAEWNGLSAAATVVVLPSQPIGTAGALIV